MNRKGLDVYTRINKYVKGVVLGISWYPFFGPLKWTSLVLYKRTCSFSMVLWIKSEVLISVLHPVL